MGEARAAKYSDLHQALKGDHLSALGRGTLIYASVRVLWNKSLKVVCLAKQNIFIITIFYFIFKRGGDTQLKIILKKQAKDVHSSVNLHTSL